MFNQTLCPMNKLTSFQVVLMQVGAVLMLAGAAIFLFHPQVSTIVFFLGALAFCSMQLLQRYEGRSFVIRRLRRQQLLGATALLLTPVLMLMQAWRFGFARRNEWVVCLTVACVLELYTAFRIPAELKRNGEC